MKAIVFERYGSPEVLQLKDVEKPTPKHDEVLIKIRAASMIAGDCEIRSFKFPVLWFWLPLRLYTGLFRPKRVGVLGQDLAGEIESVGAGVKNFRAGDHVFAVTGLGLGQELLVAGEDAHVGGFAGVGAVLVGDGLEEAGV